MQMYFDTDSHIHVNIYTKVVAVGRQQPSKEETSTCQSYCKVMQYSLSSSLSLWLPLSTYINWNVLSQITLLDSHLLSLSHYFFCTVCRLSVDMRESMRVCVCACVFVCLCVFVRVCMRVCVALSLRLPSSIYMSSMELCNVFCKCTCHPSTASADTLQSHCHDHRQCTQISLPYNSTGVKYEVVEDMA